ncbi:MAG: NAD(P)/FAD-dependent oxidoreductase [Methanomassiliicoccales archaeon]|nr:MAG: NAD(P)/FAD-dependent oxidoreductase [Methanomassiliicoccales archaeon]
MAYDVVVVGAGPAGAVAASYAAKKGASTLIIDRKTEIGKPVRCAEVVASTLPENFGMKNTSEWLINEAHYFRLISPRGRQVKINTSPYVGYVLDRASFEKELIWMALDDGAELILGKPVTKLVKDGVAMGGEVIRAKIIIAADGVDSRIGRQAGIETKSKIGMLGSCAQHTLVNIDIDPDFLEFYLGGSFAPGGYAWIFPKSGNEANVGVGILKHHKQGAVKVLENFIKNRFSHSQSTRFVTGCVPSTLPPKECVKGNVVIVGDAARQVNPFTGAGIANAFVAGKIAGELCGTVAVKNNSLENLKKYDSLWRTAFEKKLKKSYRLRNKVLVKDRNIELFCVLLKIIPAFILRKLAKGLHY